MTHLKIIDSSRGSIQRYNNLEVANTQGRNM